ncbi:MAG: lytic transglycosylase domain-containing protein, partial [Sphingomonadales bacterium]
MSQSSTALGLTPGAIRAGFETAARTHAAARSASDGTPLPAARQITAPRSPVEAAIAHAAQTTSVDFNYLLAQAEVESAMNPDARAATSSATGLYQFIESTWLDTVRKHGHRFGLGAIADQISLTPSGSAFVADPAQRSAILALRSNPQIASLMAAGLAENNRAHLLPILGRQPSHAELYLAHFLGAGGAGRFLSELQADPAQNAAALFARPAAANRGIFYASDGRPRSLAQVMDVIGGK